MVGHIYCEVFLLGRTLHCNSKISQHFEACHLLLEGQNDVKIESDTILVIFNTQRDAIPRR
jgi:hypothetical protein